MIFRPWFWLAVILAALWAPVLIVETVIDPPADWVTNPGRR
jgi:hypothetical protein